MPGILPDPPSYLCRALHRAHPSLRMAWVGRAAHDPEDRGLFCLVRIAKIRDVGTPAQPLTLETFFSEADAPGPIYSKDGVPDRRDWDPLFEIPIYHMDICEAFGFSTRDVYNGRLYNAFSYNVQRNQKVVARDKYEAAAREGSEMESNFNDLMGTMGENLWRDSMATGQTSPIVSKEDIRRKLPQHYRKFKDGRGFNFKRWHLWRKGLISNKDYFEGASV